ncbi:interferon alpha/beta receptor 1a-like [Erpetoichthys calabaricus]|uniref:Interferon alpha/beta receptor 1a-like n=1 Tax=Erpetoichthys calabaricus TaxID=27687 RepID=A0A8C4T9F5_ERPCA|nr:interferon alpha/beta receptor 1a-like [Erpetoichthys calabaricus]
MHNMRRLLLWMPLVLWFIEAVKGGLEVPQNVRIHAVNTRYVLKWDWMLQGAHQNVTFTAGYLLKSIRKKSGFISVCEHIMETHCDFCKIPFHYNGLFYFQVRAECGDENSSWSQKTFEPEEHAELGPPSDVHVVPVNYMLKVNITDPKDCNNASMRQHLSFSYVIVYWNNASGLKNESIVTKLTTVVLSNLAPHTTYCLKVQIISDRFNKTSNFSRVACEKTLGDDDTPSGLNLTFILPLLFLCGPPPLLYLLFKVIKYVFFPSRQTPVFIKEFPNGSMHMFMLARAESVQVLYFDGIDPVPEEMAEHAPCTLLAVPVLLPQTLRQNSSDSGIYSMEETSGGVSNEKLEHTFSEPQLLNRSPLYEPA